MRGALRLLAFALVAAGFTLYLRQREPVPPAPPSGPCNPLVSDCVGGDAPQVGNAPSPNPDRPLFPAAEVCNSDSGYLCSELERSGRQNVFRWNENTAVISVRIPTPPGEETHRARQLQEAAAKGIRAWHGHPFPIRVNFSDRPGNHDFVVNWSQVLGGTELGHAHTQWRMVNGVADLEVVDFALATRQPFDSERRLTPRQVELTAAHEMGHALGLPHSDRERDVMYPTNTAINLTRRDYRTMEALYALPNGAEIRR